MPWKETGRVFERTRFIEDYLSGCSTISELSSRYHVSRKTLYKWISRHDHSGLPGLEDRSRAPIECPHRTAEVVEDAIIAFRKRFPFMGPKKIIARLSEREPDVDWPAPSTAGEILDRRGLIEHGKRRRRSVHPSRMPAKPIAPNDVMTIDYKGHFRLGNHEYCYPLTIVDGFTRYILACEALTSTRYEGTRKRWSTCSASSAYRGPFCPTTARHSPRQAWGTSPGFRCGGSDSASAFSGSFPVILSKTVHTSACTGR